MSLAPGTRVGAYEVSALLGAGGMGDVYRARDSRLGREVAIKFLPADVATDAARVARFEQEARILAALNHPNIAHIYGVERYAGTAALVMELVEGSTLAERIAHGPIPVDEASVIAAQIADALEAAHERGIVHRDLKPANIKITADGTVKVLDFGIAKAVESTGASAFTTPAETQAGAVLGTAAYMSPEHARGKLVDQRADIWAFGCVLYEMLTGRVAFDGEDTAVVLARVLEGHADLDALPRVPLAMRRTLELCFEKDPRKRLRHIGDARLALQGAFETRSTDASRSRPSSRVAWAGLAVATIAAAIVSAVHFRENAVEPSPVRLQIALPVGVSAGYFSISPDGRSLLLQVQAEGTTRLLIRPFDSEDFRELPGTEGARTGFWSDDGRQVAFAVRGALRKVAGAGGPTEEIVREGVGAVGGCWANHQIVFQNSSGGLSRVAETGGDVTPVTAPSAGEMHHESAACLPDGRFLYFRHAEEPGASAIYVGRSDLAPSEQSLTPLVVADDGPLLVADADGAQLLFMKADLLYAQRLRLDPLELLGEPVRVADNVASSTGTVPFAASVGALVYRKPASDAVQLTWFDRDGRRMGTLLEPQSTLRSVEIAPDEQRAAISLFRLGQRVNDFDVWLVPFDGDRPTPFTSNLAADLSPVWSPDGKRIAFASARESQRAIYQQLADGAPAAELLSVPADEAMLPSDWSPDGRFIVGTTQSLQGADVRILSVSGDAPEPRPLEALIATAFNETNAVFSPDGHWIAYASDESGRTEIYVRAFAVAADGTPVAPESSKRLVSNGALGAPRWRDNGQELLYVADDGKVMVVELSTADDNFEPRAPSTLFQLPPAYGRSRRAGLGATVLMDILPDASRFLVPLPVEDTPVRSLEVVLNWG
jgi:serine/threonine protein kinase/Tol biopolymer transport system component